MSQPDGTAQVLMDRMHRLGCFLLGESSEIGLDAPTAYLTMREGVPVPGGKSWNYKKMGRVGAWVWHALAGDPAEAADFRRQVLEFFADEERYGQMRTEQGCNAPHDGMHIGATMLARLAALKLQTGEDAEMMAATGRWLDGFFAMCAACHSAGHSYFPGFRIKPGTRPTSEVRDYAYLAARGMGKLPAQKRADRFFVGAKLAYELRRLGALPEPKENARLPRLHARMRVQRLAGGGFLASIEKTSDKAGEVVDWIYARGSALEFGRSWAARPPVPDGRVNLNLLSEPVS